jgi:aldehyde dehydrogenase (NAD+)
MAIIGELIQRQRDFFRSGQTKQMPHRIDALQSLKKSILANEIKICAALKEDLGKSEFESYAGEIGVVLSEISEAVKHIRSWAKPKKVKNRLINFPDRNFIYPQPYGVILIIGPWNYPLQLTLAPLVAAIAAGNCAVLKPSELAPATSRLIAEIISATFASEYVAVVEGGIEESRALLKQRFDFIFFTGGSKVGRVVMKEAAENLTPIALELGGKSPAIVDVDAKIEVTARRIIWGKFFNAGQTCVAPDYLLVNAKITKTLLDALIRTIHQFYGDDPSKSPDYSRIINVTHFDRLACLMSDGRILIGGETDRQRKYIAPTIITEISWEDPIMQEEIFGPILPVLEFEDLDTVLEKISNRPRPLALYYFSSDKSTCKKVLERVEFGGGCINDCIMHLLNPNLPFGGVGESGMGCYHGKYGFETFSHRKSILKKGTWMDIAMRYPPYAGKLKWMRKILK